MANPNSSAQRSFAAEPYDSVAAVLASKQITSALAGETIHTKRGEVAEVAAPDATDHDNETAGGAKVYAMPNPLYPVEIFKKEGDADDSAAFQRAAGSAKWLQLSADTTYHVSGVTLAEGMGIVGPRSAKVRRPNNRYEPIFYSESDNIKIHGFTLDGNRAGNPLANGQFYPQGGSPADTLEAWDQGDISVKGGRGASVYDLSFENSLASPVVFYDHESGTVADVIFEGHAREGVMFVGGRGCEVRGSKGFGSASVALPWSLFAALQIDGETHDAEHRFLFNEGWDSQAAFYTINARGSEVRGNIAGKRLGIASSGPGFRFGHGHVGAWAWASRSIVEANRAIGIADAASGRGFSVEGADDIVLRGNYAIGCRVGFNGSNVASKNAEIDGNFALECTEVGFDVYRQDNWSLRGNFADAPSGYLLRQLNGKLIRNHAKGFSAGQAYRLLVQVDGATTWGNGLYSEGNTSEGGDPANWTVDAASAKKWGRNEWGYAGEASAGTLSGASINPNGRTFWVVNNSAATTMTTINVGAATEGAEIKLIFANANTTITTAANICLAGEASITPKANQILTFKYYNGTWNLMG